MSRRFRSSPPPPSVRPPSTWPRWGVVSGIIALIVFFAARNRPQATEQIYSGGIYPFVAHVLAWLAGLFPFSLAEWSFLLVGSFVAIAPWLAWRRRRREHGSRIAAFRTAAWHALGASGLVWSAFVFLWGLNYSRPSPLELFDLQQRPSESDRRAVIEEIGRRLDALRENVNENENGVVELSMTFAELDAHLRALQRDVLRENGFPAIDAGRGKRFLMSPILHRIGVSGIYGPFTGEPNVAFPAAPGLLAFTLAHERAHLGGFAWEEAASYVALLTVWRSTVPEVRYAGWLELWMQVRVPSRKRSEGVKRDLRAISKFIRDRIGREARPARSIYNVYLKAHGVEGGVRSYSRVAELATRYLAQNGFPDDPLIPPRRTLLFEDPPTRENPR